MKQMLHFVFSVALAFLVLNVCTLAQAPQSQPPVDSLQQLNASLERLTTQISPALVHIEVAGYANAGDEDDGSKVETLKKERGSGSGVIVDTNGYIVTAYHVIEGARRVRVELDSRTQSKSANEAESKKLLDAKVVGFLKDADVAVLKIDVKNLPTLSFSAPDSLKQGQLVAEFGSPEGFRNSLSLGVVSAVARQIEPDDFMTYIQTDASQAPGSSGGPLVNIQGEMVGMIVFSITDRGKHEGLGFAVPSAMVRLVYDRVREFGFVKRASLGVEIQGVTPTLASALRLPSNSGVIVAGVRKDFSEGISLLTGDVIISFDGAPVRNVPQVNLALLQKHPGDQIVIEVWRKSAKVSLKLSLVEAPMDSEDTIGSINVDENLVSRLGIVGSAPKRQVSRSPCGASTSGVMVLARLRGTEAQADLSVGDVIRSVNTVPVTSVAQLRQILDAFKPGDAVALQIERKGKPMYVAFEND